MSNPAVPRLRHRVLALRQHLRGRLHLDEPMAGHTTMRVGGTADAYFVPEDRLDLLEALRRCRELEIPVMVVGRGSNLLVRDGGFRGIVAAVTRLTRIEPVEGTLPEGREGIVAEAGVPLTALLNHCRALGLAGLEFATGIPGTVGGAVLMNAGAYGGSVADCLQWVEVADDAGTVCRVPREEIAAAYRSCRLPVEGPVLAACFVLERRPEAEILDRIKTILTERERRMPFGWGSAGSVFKNPAGDHAGRIIESLGFKGRRIGGAEVSESHANVIVNRDGATARDVLNLIDEIQRAAREKLGVELELELQVVGEP